MFGLRGDSATTSGLRGELEEAMRELHAAVAGDAEQTKAFLQHRLAQSEALFGEVWH